MKTKTYFLHLLVAFVVTFVVNAIVIYIWNLIRQGAGAFDWETTLFFAITLGIVLPLTDACRK